MKQLLVLMFLFTCLLAKAQGQSANASKSPQLRQFNRAIRRHFQYIDSVRMTDPEQIAAENKKLEQTLYRFRNIVFALKDSFDFDWLYIVTSPDKKLCLISWDTRMGGTMVEYATMAFYKVQSAAVRSKLLGDPDASSSNSMMYYAALCAVRNGRQTFYIARGFGQGSTALPWQEVRAFSISGNRLLGPRLFPGKAANIFVEFDIHKFTDRQRVPTIKIRNGGRKLLVPVATDDEGFAGKYKTLVLRAGVYRAM